MGVHGRLLDRSATPESASTSTAALNDGIRVAVR